MFIAIINHIFNHIFVIFSMTNIKKKNNISQTEKKQYNDIVKLIDLLHMRTLCYNLSHLFIYRLKAGNKIRIRKYDFSQTFIRFVNIFLKNLLYEEIVSWKKFIEDINNNIIEICSRFHITAFKLDFKKMLITDKMICIIFEMYNSITLNVCPLSILEINDATNVLISEKLLKLISFHELRLFLLKSDQVEFVNEKNI